MSVYEITETVYLLYRVNLNRSYSDFNCDGHFTIVSVLDFITYNRSTFSFFYVTNPERFYLSLTMMHDIPRHVWHRK